MGGENDGSCAFFTYPWEGERAGYFLAESGNISKGFFELSFFLFPWNWSKKLILTETERLTCIASVDPEAVVAHCSFDAKHITVQDKRVLFSFPSRASGEKSLLTAL